MGNIRRLFFDIEVSLAKAYLFKAGYGINVPAFQLFQEPKIICIAYKWQGKPTHVIDWGKDQCDKKLLQKFLRLAEEADEIVGHNSDKFDVKWIRTRCFFHRLPMMPQYTSIDTYKEAKKGFYFQSNGLDYINRYGGHAGKSKTEWQMWVDCTEGKRSALTKMNKYCKSDVDRLEETYNDMAPYMKHKTSIAQYRSDCPGCGSEKVKRSNRRVSASGTVQIQFKCNSCGRYHSVPETAFNRAIKLKEGK